jgi:hypothetical protein
MISAWLAWILLAQIDFGFRAGYALLDIDQHIAQFGPQNRYRKGFAETDQTQHLQLFGEIVDAIHSSGNGLDQIEYTRNNGTRVSLMRKPEIVHLEDVAHLIDRFEMAALICLPLLLLGIAALILGGHSMPAGRQVGLGVGILIGSLGLITAVVGPKELFYWLHVQIFPPDHQWFFFYQESLMTTLMKAPDIFGFISLLLVTLFLALYGGMIGLIRLVLKRATSTAQSPTERRTDAAMKSKQP